MRYDIADLINDALNRRDDSVAAEQVRAKALTLNSPFPLPPYRSSPLWATHRTYQRSSVEAKKYYNLR